MTESNGRIKLSWAQIVWGVGLVLAILGQWYDTRTQLALVRQEVSLRTSAEEAEHSHMWDAIRQAEAGTRNK